MSSDGVGRALARTALLLLVVVAALVFLGSELASRFFIEPVSGEREFAAMKWAPFLVCSFVFLVVAVAAAVSGFRTHRPRLALVVALIAGAVLLGTGDLLMARRADLSGRFDRELSALQLPSGFTATGGPTYAQATNPKAQRTWSSTGGVAVQCRAAAAAVETWSGQHVYGLDARQESDFCVLSTTYRGHPFQLIHLGAATSPDWVGVLSGY